MVSQTTVENYCLPSHTSSGRKHKGSEGGLLNLSDTVTILTFLLYLVTSIQRGDTGVAVARCIRMKHPYVKKGTLPLPPESPSMYVCPSLILTVDGWQSFSMYVCPSLILTVGRDVSLMSVFLTLLLLLIVPPLCRPPLGSMKRLSIVLMVSGFEKWSMPLSLQLFWLPLAV